MRLDNDTAMWVYLAIAVACGLGLLVLPVAAICILQNYWAKRREHSEREGFPVVPRKDSRPPDPE